MKRLKVYVAGPYSDDNVFGVLRNIGRGEITASKLFQLGFAPFTPWHDKSFVIQNYECEFDVKDFYEYSMEWLKVSDCVFVVPHIEGLKPWNESKGTLGEVSKAQELGIPVFFNYDDLLDFQLQHTEK